MTKNAYFWASCLLFCFLFVYAPLRMLGELLFAPNPARWAADPKNDPRIGLPVFLCYLMVLVSHGIGRVRTLAIREEREREEARRRAEERRL